MAKVAIVGANGLVGNALAEVLANKLSLKHKIELFGNSSVGKKVFYRGKNHTILPMENLDDSFQYAMFMATEDVAKQFVPNLSAKGVVCVDNSSAFRLQKDIPLVVPQINGNKIGCGKVIANPNCTTIQVAIALNSLRTLQPTAVTISTYQAASGAGRDALNDLTEQRSYGKLKSFRHPLFDNLIAQIGNILPNGVTTEEMKLRQECRKILELPQLCINSFCVRVPVSTGHGAFVNVKFAKLFSQEKIRSLLQAEKDVILLDDVQNESFPMPIVLRHTHYVGVGRISDDENGGINMFVVADNLLRGAAYNAYQILKISMQNNGDWI